MRALCANLAIVLVACATPSNGEGTAGGADNAGAPSTGGVNAAGGTSNSQGGVSPSVGGANTGGVHANIGGSGTGGIGPGGATGTGGASATGGNPSTGGNPGTGGAPPAPSANCSQLASVKGQWQRISPSGVTDTTSIVVDPFDSGTIWLAGAGFHQSTDCGATWTHVDIGANHALIDAGSLWSIAVDPVDRGTIFLVGAYGALGLWKSTNGGVDFEQVFTPDTEFAKVAAENFVNNISMDPHDHLHLLVMEHGGCTGFSTDCEAESTDGGKTWTLTATPKGWGEGGGVQLLNATSWLWGGSEGATGTYVTTDKGSTWKQVAAGSSANGEFTIRPLVPASDGAYYISAMSAVLRSPDGLTWSAVGNDRAVGFTFSDTTLYAMDQWSLSLHKASISNPTSWSDIAPPPGLGSNQGCPYLDYDRGNHVLYASCFAGGAWRLATD